MLVELFALPGAGKTTLTELAAQRAHVKTRKGLSAEWVTSSATHRFAHVSRAVLKPKHLAAAFRFASGARLASTESIFRLARMLAKTEWLRSQPGVLLLDQGFLQDLWSILVSGKSECPSPELLSPLIRVLYEGIEARIILIDVDPSVAASRIRARTHGASRFDDLPENEVRQSLTDGSNLLHAIGQAVKLAGLQVETLDGSKAPDELADQLSVYLPKRAPVGDRGLTDRPQRVSIIGSTGSGKTILAGELADRLSLPHHELDRLRLDEKGSPLPKPRFHQTVADIAAQEAWLIDGHYRDTRHLIWARAEVVVWLNYPLHVVVRRLGTRYIRKHSPLKDSPAQRSAAAHVRSSQPASWSQRLSRLVRTMRERREYGQVLRSPEYHGLRIVELTSTRMARRWLQCF
jgi:hypothetical protein